MKFAESNRAASDSGGRPCLHGRVSDDPVSKLEESRTQQGLLEIKDVAALMRGAQSGRCQCWGRLERGGIEAVEELQPSLGVWMVASEGRES